ncbi:MAG: orotidine-5'-phosphate decarboxylase [Hyphomonadaceae bacterium]|nr:MAG: orotidine-5'-phosphate decarboxylase [Caulobacteraceae bacterium]MBT9444094.1 orotidine-5'-phosphate decarboxylase [Hyphomonadaceae bacterium]TPW07323.1 MAG: orotidine-5'-phosphate decarboxylase [Alphaproteobacteria bacterium]
MSGAFADRLTEATRACGAPLCVGLDPFPHRIPALFGDARGDVGAVEKFSEAILERAAGKCAAVKPQIGLFEPYGPEGFAAARALTAKARTLGLPVILDAKRGDIGTTAEGYARATLGPAPGFDADCVTVNPYLGLDSLEPFLALAEATGKGVAVLVRTSNPGARDVQDLLVDGAPLWTRVAEMLKPTMDRLASGSGWSNLMVVAGATWPEEARRLRTILPTALFLVPGYGAQGASAADALAGLVGGFGGIVSASRSILYPSAATAARTMSDWNAAIDDALLAARTELSAT